MSNSINLYTIGFTQKSAKTFFDTLIKAGVKTVIDTRLNNVSQLAGFTKKTDLEYFLEKVGSIKYIHILDLAPTKDILDAYKKNKGDWKVYEQEFLKLMSDRQVEKTITPQIIDSSCLLCSEAKPHHCHRRLVAEYLNKQWGNINICHL